MIRDDVAAFRLRLTAPHDNALRRLAEADNVDPGLVRAGRHERLSAGTRQQGRGDERATTTACKHGGRSQNPSTCPLDRPGLASAVPPKMATGDDRPKRKNIGICNEL